MAKSKAKAQTESGRSIREASARSFVTWTPALIRSAEILAQGGNLRLAADLAEEILIDDRVNGVLSSRIGGLLGLPLEFEPGLGRRKGRAIRALEAGEDWWSSFPEDQLSQLLGWGIVLGVGLGQMVWSYNDAGRVVGKLKTWHPRALRFDWNTREWMLQLDDSSEIIITPGDGTWILYTPYGANRPWAFALWRGLARWWLLKQYARSDFGRVGEMTAARVGTAPQGATVIDRRAFASDLQNMGSDTGICCPSGFDVKLIETKASTHELFVAQNKLANDGITILIGGQNLTTEVSGGSLAAAQVHAEVRADKIRNDDETLATTIHDQYLERWADLNFGDPGAAPWPLHETSPPTDTAALATTWSAAGDAINKWKLAGANVDLESAAERFDVPLIESTPLIAPPIQVVPPTTRDGAPSPADQPSGNEPPSQ